MLPENIPESGMPVIGKTKSDVLHLKLTGCMKKITTLLHLLLLVVTVFTSTVKAQDNLAEKYTDISKVGVEEKIYNTVSSFFTDHKADISQIIANEEFKPGVQHSIFIPTNIVTKRLLLKFNISNSADSAISVFFCPGFYFDKITLYRLEQEGLTVIPAVLPPIAEGSGYRLISLPAHDSATIIAELRAVKTYNNGIKPRLIGKDNLQLFLAKLHSNYNQTNLITYVFCGLLLMMILFSITNFLQGGNREFLYYSGYAFFLGGLLLFQTIYHLHSSQFGFFLEEYLDFILQGVGIIFYMLFMKKFLNTKNKHPFLATLYNAGIIMLCCSMFIYTFFLYFSNNYSSAFLVENLTKILLLCMIIIFLVYSIRQWKDKLLRYLFWGNLFLLIFSFISQLGILMGQQFKSLPGILGSALIYYEVGLFLELVFFLAGLNYKNRKNIIVQTKERETLKAQNLLKEYEKEIAVYKAQQEERQRISADMHDELGAGMTAIRLMSEIARNKMKENTPVEIEKISQSADDVLNKMNAIIWSMNSGNDTLDNLISYIRSYSIDYFDNTPVHCQVTVPVHIPEKELTGDKRRNIFLTVKETLNNVLKHSAASLVTIEIETNATLQIVIKDNGKGIDMDKLRQFGNGLKNIARRMESIGGTLKIENNNGTITTLTLPL